MKHAWSLSLVLIGGALASIAWTVWYTQTLQPEQVPVPVAEERHINSVGSSTVRDQQDESGLAMGEPESELVERLEVVEQQLADLQQALIQEQRDDRQLRLELEALEAEVAQLTSSELALTESSPDSIFTEAAPEFTNAFPRPQSRSRDVSDRQALVAAGIDEASADELSARLDQRALALLELRDQAIREDWIQTDRYQTERDSITDSVDLRDELGDAAWDAYLFNAGRNNRVGVTSVLNGSAASNAGIEPGDMLLSYAERRIFTITELQQATRAGERNESVSVEISRQNSIVTVSLPRGPLGVTLTAGREDPAASADL